MARAGLDLWGSLCTPLLLGYSTLESLLTSDVAVVELVVVVVVALLGAKARVATPPAAPEPRRRAPAQSAWS